MSDENMREAYEAWNENRDGGSSWDAWQASSAHSAARIADVERENARLKQVYQYECDIRNQRGEMLLERNKQIAELEGVVGSACEFYQSIIDANYQTWDCGLDNADEFVRWIKSRAVHAMSTSTVQTAEQYKRKVQDAAFAIAADRARNTLYVEGEDPDKFREVIASRIDDLRNSTNQAEGKVER